MCIGRNHNHHGAAASIRPALSHQQQLAFASVSQYNTWHSLTFPADPQLAYKAVRLQIRALNPASCRLQASMTAAELNVPVAAHQENSDVVVEYPWAPRPLSEEVSSFRWASR